MFDRFVDNGVEPVARHGVQEHGHEIAARFLIGGVLFRRGLARPAGFNAVADLFEQGRCLGVFHGREGCIRAARAIGTERFRISDFVAGAL